MKSRRAFCESLEGLVSFSDAAVKHPIRVVRVKFVYVAPQLAPETVVGKDGRVAGVTPVVLDPRRDPAIKRTLSRAPRSTALSHLKKHNVKVTCELWFRTVVADHLTSFVLDVLPDTAATAGDGTVGIARGAAE